MTSLGFVHPAFLWLAFLAGLPPLIHLLGRRKPRRLVFPPFSFVRALEEKTRSRRRLRSIVLLVLRTALLLMIPAALARPQILAPRPAAGAAFDLNVVIVDNSMSGSQLAGGEPALEKMKRRALAIAGDTSETNRFLLVTASAPPALLTPFPVVSPALARAAVNAVRPTHAATAIGGAVGIARAAVDAAAPGSARGFLLSDLARHGLREAEDLSITVGGAKIPFVVDDPVPEPGQNLAPVAVAIAGKAGGARITVTVANHARAGAKTEVRLKVAGAAPRPVSVEVPGRGTAEAVFDVSLDASEGIVGEASLAPDALTQDNTLVFARSPGKETRVLLVDGDPRTVKYADETFYVERALGAGGAGEFNVMSVFPEAIPDDLGRYDVVALLNAVPPSAAQAARIEEFVRSGGGLLVAAGDHTDPTAINAMAWLPAGLAPAPSAPGQPGLVPLAAGHPALAPFQDGAEPLAQVKVLKRFELLVRPGAVPLLATGDGRTLTAAGVAGEGRVIVHGTTLDRDWSDWPIRTSFLPAVRTFVKHLSKSRAAWSVEEIHAGGRRTVRVDACPASLVPAGGGASVDLPCRTENGAVAAIVTAPREPGLFEIVAGEGRRRTAYLIVTTDPAESDLEKAPRAEVEAALGAARRPGIAALMGIGGDDGGGPPIASWLLLLIALALGAEQWITRRG